MAIGTYSGRVRRNLNRFVLLALVILPVTLFFLGNRACPPPSWAFWRFSDNGNFACVR